MSAPSVQSRVVKFGVFEVDLQEGQLRRSGLRQKLGPQPFQVLAALLERPGEIVSRDELRDRLWPDKTFVDHELALKKCVNRIREVLGDSAENPRFVETVPRRGYRFIAPVQTTDPTHFPVAPPVSPDVPAAKEPVSPRSWVIVLGAIAVASVCAMFLWWRLSSSMLAVDSIRQLTDDRVSKAGIDLETDGNRVYFNEGTPGDHKIVEVSVSGGQTAQIATQLVNPTLAGLDADGSALLVFAGNNDDLYYPLWSVPLPAGDPLRLGNMKAAYADLLPDGRILYTLGSVGGGGPSSLYIADRDGATARKLVEVVQRIIVRPYASPDGTKVNFTSVGADGSEDIFEVGSDGTDLRELVHGGQGELPQHVCCAKWTANGKFLVFQAQAIGGRWDLWTLPEPRRTFHFGDRKPIRLTNGPLSYDRVAPSRDGRKIFAIGSQRRSDLVRYDAQLRQFVPYLSGVSALAPSFSQDGKWVAYVSYPDFTLWRSRTDGTERLQLTFPPMIVRYPQLSPDGSQISFSTPNGDAFVIASAGGAPRKVAEHAYGTNWTPDGSRLIYTSAGEPDHKSGNAVLELRTLSLRDGTVTVVPGSEGKFGAFFVDQNTIVAASQNPAKFFLYDFNSQRWSELWSSSFLEWYPSPDRKYLYATTGGNEPMVMRVRLSDHKVEPFASLKNIRLLSDFNTLKMSVAPDGSPVFARDISSEELYALSMK